MSENQMHGWLNQPNARNLVQPNDWKQLAPPPRNVSRSVGIRVQFWTFTRSVGTGSVFLFVVGLICLIGGAIFIAVGKLHHLFGVIPILFGFGVLLALAVTLIARSNRNIKLLQNGHLARATISKVWSSTQAGYVSYDRAVEEWKKFSQGIGRNQSLSLLTGQKLRHWRCTLCLSGAEPAEEVKTRMDLSTQLMNPVHDPSILVFQNSKEFVAVNSLPPNLVIGRDGQWAVNKPTNGLEIMFAFFRSFLPVLGVYGSAAIGYSFHNRGMLHDAAWSIPPLLGVAVVLLFTLTHAVVPVFFYHKFLKLQHAVLNLHAKPASRSEHPATGLIRFVVPGFIYVHMTIWYGMPTIALAFLTGWFILVWTAVHIAFAKRPTRMWLCLEYGSTSMALLLFVVCFSASQLFPYGIAVVLFQSLLLTILEWKGRKLWVPEVTTGA